MKKHFLATFLTFAMLVVCTLPMTAMAANVPADTNSTAVSQLLPLSQSDISYEDALSALGMSANETSPDSLYVLSYDISDLNTSDAVLDSIDEVIEIPNGGSATRNVSFTGSHTGTTIWTILGNAPVMRWGAVLTSISDSNATVTINCHRNDSHAIIGSETIYKVGDNCQGAPVYTATTGSSYYFSYRTVAGVTAKLTIIVVAGNS